MSKIIGIDLGTTNSCVSVMEGGEPTVIQNSEGLRTTPSVIGFTDKGDILVGQPAKNQMITNPENTIYSVKRFMGNTYDLIKNDIKLFPYKIIDSNNKVKVQAQKKDYTPQEISAQVLKKMKQAAEDYLGTEVKEAVITVPAYFNDAQRQATKDAGTIAGLEVKRIVNEPTAAALAYGMDKIGDQKIAVFDLGGGTFDISILELGDGVFEVKSTNGDTLLGGDNFDELIINYLISEFQSQNGINLKEDKMALQRLKEAAEKAKKELSSTQATDINLPFITADQSGPKHLNIQLTRAKFNQITEKLIEKLRKPCLEALSDAGLSPSDLHEVLLVGGSTRIPRVQEIVKEIFKKESNKSVNPDEVVALGAAVQGGILGGDVKDILLLDVTPLSLGIETLGGIFTKLIEKNTTIPSKKSEIFSTAAENQNAVSIVAYQGERKMARDNKLLGKFDLLDIPPAPRGVPQIEVSFDIDANGILNVSAKDLGTGKENKIKIETSGGLSEQEIERMVQEAKENQEKDNNLKELVEAKNNGDQIIFQIEKTLKEIEGKVPEETKKKIEVAVTQLKKYMSEDNLASIKSSIEELSKISAEILQSQQQTSEPPPNEPTQEQPSSSTTKKEDIVDADFEVIDDDKNKKDK